VVELETMTAFDRRAASLAQLIFECRDFGRLLNPNWDGKNVLDLYFWTVIPDSTRTNAMLVAPLPSQKDAWGSLGTGLFCQEMVERAEKWGVQTCGELACCTRKIRSRS
jgi:hypothetical protein